ncbi:MAG TPA: L,D-transpeptidase, partial [Solirubrobacteraceae bacterium]|nr:L,D-transpeptidase [Solirubrobacteraceae bacterium]
MARTGGRLAGMIAAVLALGAASAPAGALAAGSPLAATPVRLSVSGLFLVHADRVTVPWRPVVVAGSVAHYVAGEHVSLTATLDGRVVLRRTLWLGRRGRRGHFQTVVRAPRAGSLRITLAHVRDRRLLSFVSSTGYAVLSTVAGPGATGRFVQLVQQRLAALHLYLRQSGVLDQGTELALDAYHRLLGRGEGHTALDGRTVTDLLDGIGRFHVRFPAQGPHAEGDLSDQVLAFTDGPNVRWLFPISSGKPSTPTVLGQFQVYYKQPYYTSDGMYFSSFFTGGYAIHGYDPAPPYPASHGC